MNYLSEILDRPIIGTIFLVGVYSGVAYLGYHYAHLIGPLKDISPALGAIGAAVMFMGLTITLNEMGFFTY